MTFNIKNQYHATNSYFEDFRISGDIGFHFGSKKAAGDRIKALGGKPEVRIEKNTYPQTNPFGIMEGDEHSDCIVKRAIATIIPRLDNPSKVAVNKISKCNKEELTEFINEYKQQPISTSYIRIIENIGKGDDFTIMIDGIEAGVRSSKSEATQLKKTIESSFFKNANLSIKNPIRLEDLGTWSAHSLCLALNLDSSAMSEVLSMGSEDAYKRLVEIIESNGYDGIVYDNAVEGIGDSYIVFHPEQIELINKPTLSSNFER